MSVLNGSSPLANFPMLDDEDYCNLILSLQQDSGKVNGKEDGECSDEDGLLPVYNNSHLSRKRNCTYSMLLLAEMSYCILSIFVLVQEDSVNIFFGEENGGKRDSDSHCRAQMILI